MRRGISGHLRTHDITEIFSREANESICEDIEIVNTSSTHAINKLSFDNMCAKLVAHFHYRHENLQNIK